MLLVRIRSHLHRLSLTRTEVSRDLREYRKALNPGAHAGIWVLSELMNIFHHIIDGMIIPVQMRRVLVIVFVEYLCLGEQRIMHQDRK